MPVRGSLLLLILALAAPAADPARHNVVWQGLGRDAGDSMPLGNGDAALNVWTEGSGDLVFTIAKNDAWTENVAGSYGLAKLGRVRIGLQPSPFLGDGVSSALHLEDGSYVLSGGGARIRVWVDANHPVIRVEAATAQPTTLRASFETWRTEAKDDLSADLVAGEASGIAWYHHNAKAKQPQAQGRIFGGLMEGPGLSGAGTILTSAAPATAHTVRIHTLTTADADPREWRKRLDAQAAATVATVPAQAWTAHQAWWHGFWERSWIEPAGDAQAEAVGHGYARQRFITACASRGEFPVKFNGSLFTVDYPEMQVGQDKTTKKPILAPVTGDFRAWGGQYWFQNTRPIYWPCLAAGDVDLMRPLFRMYSAQIPGNAALVEKFYRHKGSYLAETAPWWGGIPDLTKNPGSYTAHYFTPVLELSSMLLDAVAYTGDDDLARKTLVPLAEAGLTFFAEHFPQGADGKLCLDQDNAIEMYWKVRDPLPDIAGLHWVLDRLLELNPEVVPADTRARWEALRRILPDVPVGEPVEGQKAPAGTRVLRPYAAGQTQKAHNFENPELYAVYPFRLFGVGKPDLALARATFAARIHAGFHCWGQDPVQAAYLGLADEARKKVVENLTRADKSKRLRFPAFWDKGHDYAPDQCDGGNGMLGLQRMLLHAEGRRLILLPAWPKDWTADFRLHAPLRTVLTGRVEGGKLVRLEVTPAERRADVVLAADVR